MSFLERPWHPRDCNFAVFCPVEEAREEMAHLPEPDAWRLTEGSTLWLMPEHWVVAIYGLIVPPQSTVGYAMLLCGLMALRYPLPLVRAVRRALAREAQHHELTAIYAETRADWVTGRRFLGLCGFTPGTLFFPDGPAQEMYVQYEWTPEGRAPSWVERRQPEQR